MMRVVVVVSLPVLSGLVSACGTVPERRPLPAGDGGPAPIPGLPEDARYWGDEVPEFWLTLMDVISDEELRARYPAWVESDHNLLAISGGGLNGAFGAGLLNGWTHSGTRPDEFLVVTGISTGALIAPFAFLGPDYDDELKEVYTTLSTRDLVETRYWTEALTSDAAVDSTGLREVIGRYVDDEMIWRLADEDARGRTLMIGTTNLDARRPVIWELNRIAASDHPDKKQLIGDVLLASASIPGAFPPVLFEVEKDGERFDELHVDGGAASQVFIYPGGLDLDAFQGRVGSSETHTVYVIRNSKLAPTYEPVDPRVLEIVGTTISSLIRTQGIGDLNSIYLLTRREGGDYRLAYIPEDFADVPEEPFDRHYMNRLYQRGFGLAKEGYRWDEAPPAAEVARGKSSSAAVGRRGGMEVSLRE